jgi:rod shape-determining protein MreD
LSSFRSKPHVAPFVGPVWYVAAAWLAAAVLAQSTVVHYLAVRGVVPSVVLVVVVWYAIRVDARRAVLYGLIAGFCEDALAPPGAGWTIATSVSALLASVLSRGFFADSIPLVIGITILATIVRALVFWIVAAIGGFPPGLSSMHAHEAALQSALNVVVIVVAMLIARRFDVSPR